MGRGSSQRFGYPTTTIVAQITPKGKLELSQDGQRDKVELHREPRPMKSRPEGTAVVRRP